MSKQKEGYTGVTLLRLKDVCKITGLGKSTVWKYSRLGRFPRPVKVTGTVTAWRSDELSQWVEDRQRLMFEGVQE